LFQSMGFRFLYIHILHTCNLDYMLISFIKEDYSIIRTNMDFLVCMTVLSDDGNSHGASVAIIRRVSSATSCILSCGGLPELLDPSSSAHQVGLRKNPPCPPRVHSSYWVCHVIQPLG
jgi:hypothetical protein